MSKVLALLTLLLAIPAASAQIVHPNQYAANEGTSANSWPFRFTNSAGHYQQSYDGTQFSGPITITEVAFRYRGDTAKPAATADFKLTLGYCANGWGGLLPTFASNFAVPGVKVHDGVWNIAAFNGDPAVPNPFTARLKLTTPFTYDPAQGDLLMDVEMRQSTYPAGGLAGSFASTNVGPGVSRLYANTGNPSEPTGSISPVYGLVTEFTEGLFIPYGNGCAGTGGFVPELSMSGNPTAGGQVTLNIDKGLGGAMSAILIGQTKASTPLGGGCTLHINPVPLAILIPLGGAAGTPGTGSVSLPALIPATVPPSTIYLQVFVGDTAGPIGMSATNGLQVDFQ